MPLATIKDVARLAGVSPSTVSRVLSGSSRISPETQERVRQAMRELNYLPNAIARSLVRRTTATIALSIARPAQQALANPFFPELIRGICSVLEPAGYHVLLSTYSNPTEERHACLRLLRQRRADGLILTSSYVDDSLIDALVRDDLPFVLVGRVLNPRPITWVNNDNVAVGAVAVEHLIARGHRRIAHIAGPQDLVVSLDRRQGYEWALQAAGLPAPPEYVPVGQFTWESGYRAMADLLALPEPPTAVFCADDAMALGAFRCLKERGIPIGPGGVALVGVNDDPISSHLQPALSTVRIPVYELGATAARLLLDRIQQGQASPRQIVLPSQLVVRESSNWVVGGEPG